MPTKRPATRLQASEEADGLSKATIGTVKALVAEGALSKAARHLVSERLADIYDPAVVAELRRLHPNAPLPTVPLRVRGLDLPDIPADPNDLAAWLAERSEKEAEEAKRMTTAVKAFPPGSAAGPSGLRPAHLKECLERPTLTPP